MALVELKSQSEIEKEKIIKELNDRLQEGRHYLMSVQSNEVTVEDALEAFGFGRNGLLE